MNFAKISFGGHPELKYLSRVGIVEVEREDVDIAVNDRRMLMKEKILKQIKTQVRL